MIIHSYHGGSLTWHTDHFDGFPCVALCEINVFCRFLLIDFERSFWELERLVKSSYHIVSYHIISYHINFISFHIISYHIHIIPQTYSHYAPISLLLQYLIVVHVSFQFSISPQYIQNAYHVHSLNIHCLKPVYIYGPVSRVPTPPWDGGGYDAPVVVYIHTYLHTYLHTYVHTYIPLHYLTLHSIHTYIPLHYITLPYITLPYITLPYIPYIHTYIDTYIHTYQHTNIPTYHHHRPQGGGTRRTIPPPQAKGGGDQKNHTTTTGHRGGGPEEPDDTVHPYPLVGGGGGVANAAPYIYIYYMFFLVKPPFLLRVFSKRAPFGGSLGVGQFFSVSPSEWQQPQQIFYGFHWGFLEKSMGDLQDPTNGATLVPYKTI